MCMCIAEHKNEIWSNSTTEQIHLGKDHILIIAVCGYRTSVENVKFNTPIQHASPDDNSRIIVTVSFRDVTGIKLCPDLSPNELALRIAGGTETILIRK
ncbi:hypothetical protein TNCV_1999331 [Trichonephila clavipes]|nr:hypothetical protein TNCV_1999331 [Trichonephila clavipes]